MIPMVEKESIFCVSESSDSSDADSSAHRGKKHRRRKDKRRHSMSTSPRETRSISPLSRRAGAQTNRPMSPFSAKLNPGGGMTLPGMNEPNGPPSRGMAEVGMNAPADFDGASVVAASNRSEEMRHMEARCHQE